MKAGKHLLLYLLLPFLFLTVDSQAQTTPTVCTIQDSEIKQFINNPSGKISITNEYYFPIRLSKQQTDTLIEFLTIHQIINTEQQALLQNQPEMQAEQQPLEDAKEQFQKEIKQVFNWLKQVEKMILEAEKSKSQISPKRIQEAKDQVANVQLLTQSTQCMSEELDIKVTVDSSGREEYGFLKEQLFQNPNFFHLGAFHEGLAVVKAYNNVYGYVDDKGEMVVDPQYQFASPMSNGRAVVKKFQKWYILNSEFELKPFGAGSLKDMEGATSARPGFLVIQTDGKYHILNTNLQSLELSVPYDSIVYRPQEQVFWCKTDMEEVLYSVAPNQELKVIIRSINIFFDIGLPKQVKYLEEDALSWRLLDLSDIDNPTKSVNKFFGISAFYHQTLAIAETSILTGAGTIYLIDRRGKIVSTFRDTYSVDIFDELLNDKYIIIGVDLSGQKNLVHYFYEKKSAKKLHKKPVYGFAKSGLNQHGHLQVANKRDKWGIIDTAGQQVLDYVSDRPLAYSNATYVATREGKVGAFDIKGQQLTEIKYDRLSGYYNGFYVFTLNAKKGVVNYKSAEIIPPIFAQIKVYKEFFLCSPPTIKGKSSFGIDRRGKCLSGDCEEYKQLLTEYYQKN